MWPGRLERLKLLGGLGAGYGGERRCVTTRRARGSKQAVRWRPIFSVELGLLIVALALHVVVGRGTFAVIVGFVAYGLLLSLAWMGLSAPDVALTEAALGGGVTGALLLRAHARLRGSKDEQQPVGVFGRAAALLLCLGVSACLIIVVLTLPAPAPTLAPEAITDLAATGLGNAVTAVLMVYRALDTMLEKVVLLLALVAVWSLAADRNWGDRPVFESGRDTDGPLIFLARVLIPLGVMVGIYLFWVGADDPGGAFAGGAMISAMGLLGFFAGVCAVPASERSLVANCAGVRDRSFSRDRVGRPCCRFRLSHVSEQFRQAGHRLD